MPIYLIDFSVFCECVSPRFINKIESAVNKPPTVRQSVPTRCSARGVFSIRHRLSRYRVKRNGHERTLALVEYSLHPPTLSVLITPTDKSHSEIIIGQNVIHHKEANVEFTPPVQINNP